MEKHLSGEIVKVDDEQGRVYGWAYVITKNGEQVEDHSGDVIDTPEARRELEEAFVDYVKDHRTGDLDHEQFNVSRLIEAAFITKDKAETMGLSTEREGLWVGYEFNRDTPKDKQRGKQRKLGVRSALSVQDGERVSRET